MVELFIGSMFTFRSMSQRAAIFVHMFVAIREGVKPTTLRLMAILSNFPDAKFDNRGASLIWVQRKFRVDGQVRNGLVIDAPTWMHGPLEPVLRALACTQVSSQTLKTSERAYILVGEPSDELHALLDLLQEIKMVNRSRPAVDQCYVLDMYKTVTDDEPKDWPNTETGRLVSASKYRHNSAATEVLVGRLTKVVTDHPILATSTCVVSVPGQNSASTGHGELVASRVAEAVGIPFLRTTPRYGTRPPAKEGGVLTAAMIAVDQSIGTKSRVLIVDDVVRSGRSIEAVANLSRSAGASTVNAVIGAKTMRN